MVFYDGVHGGHSLNLCLNLIKRIQVHGQDFNFISKS